MHSKHQREPRRAACGSPGFWIVSPTYFNPQFIPPDSVSVWKHQSVHDVQRFEILKQEMRSNRMHPFTFQQIMHFPARGRIVPMGISFT